MKNSKLNIIKLNVITAILTSICISCAPFGNVNPNKLKNPTTSKTPKKVKRSNNSRNLKNLNSHANSENSSENNKNLENESQNSKSSNQHSQEETTISKSSNQHSQEETTILKSSNQHSQEETTISKLENIGKGLEAQKKEEDIQIAKSYGVQYDFLETFKLQRDDYFMFNAKMQLKRIIYPSLNYDTKKILALKEILETLDTDKNRRVARKFLETSRDIQLQLEDIHLKKIQDKLHTLSIKEAETLLQDVKRDLRIKQNFTKTLNATIDAYNKNVGGIKTNAEALAKHIKDKYFHRSSYLLNQAD
ncbi:complement regulator-acquiring protein [Borreliella garinii]|uniref:complement regulator-acquiring protein n=2 Tax=Borreliella garinii TaxID=29519 RepID=UPI0004164094|nr:complement regulator-acquiring protein [Borreliella garinii]